MKSLLKISGLVTFILTEYFICPFFLHFSQKKGVDEIYFINTIYYRTVVYNKPPQEDKKSSELNNSGKFTTFFFI